MNNSPIRCYRNPFRYHPHQSNTFIAFKLVRVLLPMLVILTLVSSLVADEGTSDGNKIEDGQLIDVWIGTGKEGIYHLTLDTESGKLSEPTMESLTSGAGFLAMHPNGKVLYSTDREDGGSVSAFELGDPKDVDTVALMELTLAETRGEFGQRRPSIRIIQKEEIETLRQSEMEKKGSRLTFLNRLKTSDGGAACIAVDQTGSVLVSAQYGGGSVSSFTITAEGKLGARVETIEHGEGSKVNARQKTAHPHWVGTSPDNRFVMVPDLGLDRVVVYELDSKLASLKPHSKIPVPPGAGPRHMKFHISGKYAYVLNEMALTISVFEYEAKTANFKEVQVIKTLSEEAKAKEKQNTSAEIRVHPNGKFVYSSNRGHDSISVFSVDQATGKLALVENVHVRGAWPRNFNLDPSGKWLIAAGQNSNTLSLFEVDPESGKLTYTQKTVNVPAPICVLFGPKSDTGQ